MNNQSENKILTNVELKDRLDAVNKDLDQFDNLANTIEEQEELLAVEKKIDDSTI